MSGDVQPRKRKDKKRKKDDTAEQIPTQPQTPSSSSSNQNEDITIHVHKEDGTGGGICAKIIFFILFTALAVLIGLIITEHRGLTDLDTADQESRFSHLFEGWIDNSVGHDEHDEGDHVVSSLEDEDHGEDEEGDSHEAYEEEEEEEDHDEHEEEASEEVAQTEEEEDEEEEEEAEASEEVAQTEEDEDEEEAEASEEVPATEEEEEEEEEDESELKDADEDEEVSEENVEEDEEDKEEEEEEDAVSKDVEQSVEEQDEDEADEPDEEDEGDEEAVASKEAASEEEDAPEQSEEKGSEELKEDEQASQEQEEDEVDVKEEGGEDAEDENQQNTNMVVKIGVGVALLVVAHVVLVRKWKSATPPSETPAQDEAAPDLSRRNTIVVPPTYQEVQRDIEEAEEEYSDEDGEVESDEDRREVKPTKLKYGELRTTYARSLTPESEPEYQTKPAEADDEEYEEEEEEEVEDEEEEEEEEEDEESETGEYEKEDDDDDLLKRLEARYGKLQRGSREAQNEKDLEEQFSSWKRINVGGDNEPEESESDKQSDAETDEYENITNKDDYKIKEKLDEAHKNIQNNTAYAIKLFDALLQNYSSSPRSLYGKAQALDILADKKRSNDILQKAIAIYLRILTLEKVPDALFETVADRCINRMRFMGNYRSAIDVHHKLIERFPEETKYKNQLVVSYLIINRVNKARILLEETLSKHPNDGFALVHYGFILKTIDNKLNESVSYLQKGISTKAPGVIDGRFYFHLGDALARLGKTKEAMEVYEDGVKHNLFLSKYQRSLYNVAHLKGQPWWKKEETPYAELYTALENNWQKIREEGISVLNKNGLFQSESENLKDTGDWKQFELFARGQKNVNNCKKCPITCRIIESVPDARGCRRGQTKFSVMHPGTHVWPHCGPTNCRLRVHLGLKVPPQTYIRVADEVSWKNGEVFIFDDSFEHEVWHNGTSFRLVLIVDVWHPELKSVDKRSLSPI
ncbi:aspartyl/asparaginyl beta-hydroxylase isoform X2 [Zophobas morio]|uniref:aspartyl/asparaginyl beta-hydroxylase isoform X2 n=1 Tax=Zophobas morio TaxID=2755281 RepID=UPI003083AA48